jgi:hypothetical protein
VLTNTSGYPLHNSASNPTVVSQYCNGSRVPPENGGLGFQVPPGIADATVPNPIFTLLPAATVDEGNNWVNLSWGPLAMTHPTTGALLGNYALAAGSPAIDYITSTNSSVTYAAAPTTDFFGNARKTATNPNVDVGAVEGVGTASGGGVFVTPTSVAFGNVAVSSSSLARTLTLTNNSGATITGITVTPATTAPAATPNVFSRPTGAAGGTCTTSLASAASCTINVVFTPAAATNYVGAVTIVASAGVTGSPVSLTGTGFVPAIPALTVLDNFNRTNATNLGANWTQTALSGVAAIQVNSNQAFCNNTGLIPPCAAGGRAFWNTAFTSSAKQAAAFQIVNTTITNDGLILAATGTTVANVYPNFIRVQISGGAATVATTTNFGVSFTTAGSVSLPGGATFANGDTVTAVLDGTTAVAAPTVYVWRTTSANVTTFLGAVQIPASSAWQNGGRIGIQEPNGARVDNFAGGIVP